MLRKQRAFGMEYVMAMNPLFFLATAAFGWGLSLATYRAVANRNGWPMGEPQANHPLFVTLIGIVTLVIAFLYATYGHNGPVTTGWIIIGLGLLFSLFWTGFLRVASQTALLLAPLAAFLLVLGWASSDDLSSDLKSAMTDLRATGVRVMEAEKRLQDRVQDAVEARRDRATQPANPGVPPKGFQPQ
jgi:hypothetical protein